MDVVFMTSVHVTCKAGYAINAYSNSTDIICQADGRWSVDPVICWREYLTVYYEMTLDIMVRCATGTAGFRPIRY
jgi:hypothetical protein